MYSAKLPLSHVEPINIKGLVALDLFHFGWNIWNHFRVGKQDEISQFLKQVFAITFKDVEVGKYKELPKQQEYFYRHSFNINSSETFTYAVIMIAVYFVSLVLNYLLRQR